MGIRVSIRTAHMENVGGLSAFLIGVNGLGHLYKLVAFIWPVRDD